MNNRGIILLRSAGDFYQSNLLIGARHHVLERVQFRLGKHASQMRPMATPTGSLGGLLWRNKGCPIHFITVPPTPAIFKYSYYAMNSYYEKDSGWVKAVESVQPLARAWEMAGKKFDWLILDAFLQHEKRRRFNELLAAIPGLTPAVLSKRLKALEQNKIISKNIVLGERLKTEYHLTNKSEAIQGVVAALRQFGARD